MASPARQWGWHALESRWATLLVAESGVPPGSLVLDIGAGHGAITIALFGWGARVIAVEAHPERARFLRSRFPTEVVVVQADAGDLQLPRRPYYVVANPPFALTSVLLKRLLQPGSRLVSGDLVLQEPAARRWAGPDAPGAGRWQREFLASLGRRLPPSAFRPPASVATRVLRIRRGPTGSGS